MSEFQEALQPVMVELQKVNQHFAEIHQHFADITQRLGAVDQRFDSVDQRFDSVDQRFDSVEQRFGAVDDVILDTRHRVRGLELKFERFQSEQQVAKEVLLELRSEDLPQRTRGLEIRVTNLEKRAF